MSAPPIIGYMYGDYLNTIFDQIHSSIDIDKEASQIKKDIIEQVSEGFASIWKLTALKTALHIKKKLKP